MQKLPSQIEEFLYGRQQGIVCWRSLLGWLSPLCLLVPGSRLRMRSPTAVAGSVGLPRRVGIGRLDTLERIRSVLVVRHPESSRQGLCRAPSPGSSVLVRRDWGQSRRLICLQSMVSRGTRDVHQLVRTLHDSHGPFHFWESLQGKLVGLFCDNTTALA